MKTALVFFAVTLVRAAAGARFTSINGLLCVRSEFVETHVESKSRVDCASLCDLNKRCQALSMANGPCQLFLFDKCSKNVKYCTCSKRGQVFVKQQPGLDPGALCPAGYVDDLCGVKYKMFPSNQLWWPSRAKCEAENGLVIMTDVVDATEMSQVDMLYSKYNIGSFWLGGYQTPGSPEPGGGYYWVACNIPVAAGLWRSPDPDNDNEGRENVIGRWSSHSKLADFWDSSSTPKGVLCECVSPFN